ncbi:MAG: hypothetical protein ABJC62_13485 [Frankiaceae bacterium]
MDRAGGGAIALAAAVSDRYAVPDRFRLWTANPRPVHAVLLRLAGLTSVQSVTAVTAVQTVTPMAVRDAARSAPEPGRTVPPVRPFRGGTVPPARPGGGQREPLHLRVHSRPDPAARVPAPHRIPEGAATTAVRVRTVPDLPRVVVRSSTPAPSAGGSSPTAPAVAGSLGAVPLPGWGAPVPPVPAAPRAPDLGRLSEEVAARLARQALAARERRGEVSRCGWRRRY